MGLSSPEPGSFFGLLRSLAVLLSSRARCRRLAFASLIALAVAIVLTISADSRSSSALIRGDFPAFYSMALLAASDEPERLYDLSEQTRIQNEAWPEMAGSVLPGAYPPYLAYLVRPFAVLGPVIGKGVWTLCCVLSFLLGVTLLSRYSPRSQVSWVELCAALMCFSPILLGVLGGQLLALSMLLYLLMIYLERVRTRLSEIALGIVMGLWLFKPQYALITLLLPLVQRRWWVLLGFISPAVLYYQLGVEVLGADWFLQWAAFAAEFAEMNFASNAAQMSNLVGVAVAASKGLQLNDLAAQLFRVAALVLSALLVVRLGLIAWTDRLGCHRDTEAPTRFMMLLGPTLSLASPQSNFYDLGLAIIPLIVLIGNVARDWIVVFGSFLAFGLIAAILKESQLPLFALLSVALYLSVSRRIGVASSHVA